MKKILKSCIVLILLSCARLSYSQTDSGTKNKGDEAEKFVELMSLANNYYTDTVNDVKLVDDAIQKVLEDLDPHSSYVPAKDVKRSEEQLVGNFEGIGITFQLLKDTINVVEVIPSGPSEKVGLQAGDKIIKVNDTIVAGVKFAGNKISNNDVVKLLRGPKGTKVKVGIMRYGEKKLIDFTITRDKIPIYSITATYMAAPGIGYIRLERFAATTVNDFMQAVEKLRSQGMTDLILDLTQNSGGYLYTAVDMCNQFLGDNQLIVYTQGLHAPYAPYNSNGHGLFKEGKVVVMVDEFSASASEILSGCLQDNDRGLLVGRRTYGKGLVQKPFTLSDGSEVKLTTAHYFTPSGRCIQKPYGKDNKDYREDYEKRLESGELYGVDTFKYADTVPYYTKNGRLVHGGGGVMPDVYVPIDTSMNSHLFQKLRNSGVENEFALAYVDMNRQTLNKQYAAADSFYNNFEITNDIITQYFATAVADSAIHLKENTKPRTLNEYFVDIKNDSTENFEKDYLKSEKLLKARLKANIGRNLFDAGMFWRVINSGANNVYARALEVMKSNLFNELNAKPAKTKGGKDKNKKKEKTSPTTHESF